MDLRTDRNYPQVEAVMSALGLHTVCESARCPNKHECWNRATATVMILGGICTRNCRFCAVATGAPGPVDEEEPERVGQAARSLGLRHVVVTSVTRDDLPDGGAEIFARTIRAVRRECPGAGVEVLTPDFGGQAEALHRVFSEKPDVFNHNLETVERLQGAVRPQASYRCSLEVLRRASESGGPGAVKSGLMLGLGETDAELEQSLEDLRAAGCQALTLGQYLAPSCGHAPVARFYKPEEFKRWGARARELGFAQVAAGPLVRSSYRAGEMAAALKKQG